MSKVKLEGAFVDGLVLLQPTPGYMRLVKDRILCAWEQRRAEARERTTEQQRRVSAIQQINRTAVTAPPFKYLASTESVACQPKLEGASGPPSRPSSQHAMADNLRPARERKVVSLNFASWNQLDEWLRQVEWLRRAA